MGHNIEAFKHVLSLTREAETLIEGILGLPTRVFVEFKADEPEKANEAAAQLYELASAAGIGIAFQ